MKIQNITLQNNIGVKLKLERIITETKDGIVYGKLWDNGLCGLNCDSRRTLQALGMRCKYDNDTGFVVGKQINLPKYKEVPNIFKQDTNDVTDLNVYKVVSIESIHVDELK